MVLFPREQGQWVPYKQWLLLTHFSPLTLNLYVAGKNFFFFNLDMVSASDPLHTTLLVKGQAAGTCIYTQLLQR